jgi:hypothetical protein
MGFENGGGGGVHVFVSLVVLLWLPEMLGAAFTGLARGEAAAFESGGGQVWVLVVLLLIRRSVIPGHFVSLSLFPFPVCCHRS